MPRKKISISCKMEYLSILDEKGKLDKSLEPDIPEDLLMKLYRAMLLGRRFDERMLSLQRQGRIGTFAPTTGQEASQVGSVSLLRPSDWMVPSFREAVAQIWRGAPMENIILYFGGYNEGGHIEDHSKDLPTSIPVGSQILHAVGLGWAANYRKTDEVVMTYFGDGATSEGDFHEGLNFAGVYQTPVIFLCQNNQWAISVPLSKQTHSETLAQKALAYGIPGIQADGNDILAVYAASKEAVDRARSGGGPTMIECVTYRMSMHTTADDPKRYRTDKEVEGWKAKDPLVRFEKYLTDKGLASKETFQAMETEVKSEIQAAVDRAEEQMKKLDDPLHMFEHAYAELPPYLKEQRAELAEELKVMHKEKQHG
jgi:pyruvate dehydrogenase E1 component alpha subunit